MALALAAGIAASDALGWPPPLSYALLVLCFAAALAIRRQSIIVADAFLLIGLLFAGMSWHALVLESGSAARVPPTDPNTLLPFTARIVDPPTRHERTWTFVADVHMPDTVCGGRKIVRSRVSMPRPFNKEPIPEPRAGDVWLLTGSVEPFPRPRNPGEMDYGAMLSLAGIDAVVRARSATRVHAPPGFDHRTWLGVLQSVLYGWIDQLHAGERAAFLKGVILGYRAELGEDLKDAFLATGTVHILAVSGGNVALIALVALVVAGLLRLRRRAAFGMAVVGILFYLWVTGSSPSVVRASVMAIVVLTAGVAGRRADVFQSLAIAAIILFLRDPRSLFDVGFQLSFISVLAIVIGSPMLEPLLRRLPEEFHDHEFVRATVQLLAVSAAAQIGTLPLTMSVFGQVSLVSVVANLVVVPLSGVILVLGVVELLFMPVLPWIGSVYAGVNDVLMDLLLGSVRVGASLPLAAVEAVRPDGWTLAALYSFLAAVAAGSLPGVRRTFVMAGCLLAVVAVWRPVVTERRPLAEIITIDVGQGDAHLIRTFHGATALVDAGPSEFTSERTILPLLQRLGIRALDEVIITHGHRDHTGGLTRLLDHLPVRTLTLCDSTAVRPEVHHLAKARGVTVRIARRGDRLTLDPAVRCYVLHPGPDPVSRSANDRSVLVRLMAGSASILLTGDLEDDGEEEVLSRYGGFVRSDLLKVAHHGSNTGTSARWLDAVRPEHAIISVGRGNSFGHPDPHRISQLRDRRIDVAMTMEAGAVWFTTDGGRWSREAWSQPGH
ncbi:MAG: DNA internalization-related competence protein ComEC/Rec2 [Bacteroidetes bacterium]|jgi:competence protein ComEC|nr:DNA internalization-related competence protein ComEC/Rec2 [Bacteroidota bacterium]